MAYLDRSLSAGVLIGNSKRLNTLVESFIKGFSDAGSIPAASTKIKKRRFAPFLDFFTSKGIEKEGAKRKKTVRGTVFADEGVIGAEAPERFPPIVFL